MDASSIFQLHAGAGALVATAIHDGHAIREDLAPFVALSAADRLREEDPFTGEWTAVAPTRVIVNRSRFGVDLNRPRDRATYRVPEDCWGLELYNESPPAEAFERSLAEYDDFYASMHRMLTEVVRKHGRFVLFDLHSYCHRREGPNGPPADSEHNPQINLGTGTLDRERWGPVVDAFASSLRAYEFPTGALDVRENVKFTGGQWPRWVNANFPDTGVAMAIEAKKFFMDEWTGQPDPTLVAAVADALRSTVAPVLEALERT